jgi:Tfp pilus assembly protein PilN
LLGLWLAATVVWNLSALQTAASELTQEQSALQRRLEARNRRPAAPPKVVMAPQQAAAINLTIQQLNVPWTALWDALEEVGSPGVALLEMVPDARAHVLRVKAEARGSDEMVQYIEGLKRQGQFEGVVLVKHEFNEQDRNHPIRFELEAPWREFGP